MKTSASENVGLLRAVMAQHHLDAYIVPSADPHQTEYAHAHWRSRAWLSGFTGSAGTVAVLGKSAGIWTDGRYFIQAAQELDGSGIDLFKMHVDDVPELIDWVCAGVPKGGAVGMDGRLITVKQAADWEEKLAKKEIRFVTDVDLIDGLWENRPSLPSDLAMLYPLEFAGRSAADKLVEIREAMTEKEVGAYLLSSLYDIAWLFNVRGKDTKYCPLLTAYALVTHDSAILFVDEAKVSVGFLAFLEDDGISVMPYADVFSALGQLTESETIYLCAERVNDALMQCISCSVETGKDLTDLPKARKNEVELKNWRRVHELDGVAMVRFWKWLEEHVPSGGVNECFAAEELEAFRRINPECQDLSFDSISAYGANAAMMHYSPSPKTCSMLESRGLYLIDSGGQYFGGTTDVTRTFALGELSDEERTDYTLVLKGMINLSSARFLRGSAGNNLDVLARQALWAEGLDYKCGTGHGVGCFLNVHEGPQNISPGKRSDTSFEPGMVVTIEPGVYKEGRHGIRTENMVVVEVDRETECGVFYRFETLTLLPIDTTPLKRELMSDAELQWLNTFHQQVFDRLSPYLGDVEQEWLKGKTRPYGV